jgi:hypothetical protein
MTNVGGPVNGDDTYDLIDYALAELARRRGAWSGDAARTRAEAAGTSG